MRDFASDWMRIYHFQHTPICLNNYKGNIKNDKYKNSSRQALEISAAYKLNCGATYTIFVR